MWNNKLFETTAFIYLFALKRCKITNILHVIKYFNTVYYICTFIGRREKMKYETSGPNINK